MKNIHVIYHRDLDGFAAAWAAWLKLGDTAEYHSTNYGEVLPVPALLEGEHPEVEVYYVDFCPPRDLLLDLDARLGRVFVIDHHKTAQVACGDLEHLCHFDLAHSGAVLAWHYFNAPNGLPISDLGAPETPPIVGFVEDYDLWRFAMHETEAICAHLETIPWEFEAFSEFNGRLDDALNSLGLYQFAESGRLLLAQRDKQVERMAKYTSPVLIDGTPGVAVNATVHPNEVARAVLARNPDARFALVWRMHDGGQVRMSFRSRSAEECNVAGLALKFRGGGHPCAAGANLSWEAFQELIREKKRGAEIYLINDSETVVASDIIAAIKFWCQWIGVEPEDDGLLEIDSVRLMMPTEIESEAVRQEDTDEMTTVARLLDDWKDKCPNEFAQVLSSKENW